ncbi:hypothetical protein [Pseudonocardia humida]|uniref:Uncharacterized protein n=1 Tax=Pseudonocardia humida TaxID=2800819 RepID=A0ABT0ZW96_9PSEU|nr:hypothetical protein [Pseudonocardia humida]MCO1655013.1 hypothetical protein [Pseudonocardia humida]
MPDAAHPAAPHAPRAAHGGQHRRPPGARARARRGVELLARVGGAVTLASLLVLGLAVAGAVDGVGALRPGNPTVTVTIADR